VRPGVVEKLFQALTVADLMAQATTTSSPVRYIRETPATVIGATAVAEGAAKPEATIVTEQVDEPVRKIACRGLDPAEDPRGNMLRHALRGRVCAQPG
jgi:hypothetical protein